MGGLFLTALTGMRSPSVIEGLPINVLRMVGQMRANRGRQAFIAGVRQENAPSACVLHSRQDVFLDLRNRMPGQILIDLGDDAFLDVGVKYMP